MANRGLTLISVKHNLRKKFVFGTWNVFSAIEQGRYLEIFGYFPTICLVFAQRMRYSISTLPACVTFNLFPLAGTV